jgi:hypothetical protein
MNKKTIVYFELDPERTGIFLRDKLELYVKLQAL